MRSDEPNAKRSGLYDNANANANDDDEVDELASISLLDAPDKQSNVGSTRNNSLRSGPTQADGTQHLQDVSAKPLPPLPSKLRSQKLDKNNPKKRVLAPKSTNMKVATKTSKTITKPMISPPILISSSTDPFGTKAGFGPSAGTDQVDTDKKISNLQQQADAQAAETRKKEKRLAAIEASSRPSPLQRGRSVLMTAKHAIASRLGSPKIKLGKTKDAFDRALSYPEYGSLSNEDSETGAASHRPLPVYESMRKRGETPDPQEEHDPFSDIMETNEGWSDFEPEFDRRRAKRSSLGNTSSSHTPSIDVVHDPACEKLTVRSKTPTTFSNKISGLRQHPDAEFFSSSPVGFSTPRVRLAPTCDANGKKRLSTVLVRDPSVMDFSFEQESIDDESDPLMGDDRGAEPSSSMKRKSATEDLRSQASKRAKTDSATSKETTVLAQGLGQLGTSDAQAMQGVEQSSENTSISGNASQNTGFGIFDMGKRKESMARAEDLAGFSSTCRHSRHSSSSSRPTSVLFSRESRARAPLLETHKDDEMDIDELQLE